MKMLQMLEDHDGCRKGDRVGFESNDEADTLIASGKAVPVAWNGTDWVEVKA